MTRAEWIALGGLAVGLGVLGAVSFKGSVKATIGDGGAKAGAVVRTHLADVTSDQDQDHTDNRWNAPAWQIASPLRQNHPLFARPCHIGENRHKVMTGGWSGWYYDAPENQVL